MKLTAMCGVVVDVFAGALRRECDNHGNLLAVHEIAETWKQSTATGILKDLALDHLSNIIPIVLRHMTFLIAYLCVARDTSSLASSVSIVVATLQFRALWEHTRCGRYWLPETARSASGEMTPSCNWCGALRPFSGANCLSVKEVENPKHVVGLKRTWDQKLSSGLLLTFMPVQPLPVPLRGC